MPLKSYLVAEVMTPHPIVVESEAPLAEVERLMEEHRIRRLPVLENGRLVGIISKGDLREARMAELASRHPYEPVTESSWLTAAEAMTTPVITVTPQTPLVEAVQLMLEHKIGGLPVLESGQLVGILTDTDVIRLLVKETLS
ncbi:MAG: CBS domain-containing protein [Anaerolineae bacterium]|jgi:CBS domain-containing protein|nr:CBS domain-containing protein [Anaerolineae bacterium]MDH7474244.1 CBS domain-containing protein [Anaerolineae bacterium]